MSKWIQSILRNEQQKERGCSKKYLNNQMDLIKKFERKNKKRLQSQN